LSIEFLDHTADASVRITGRDGAEFFQEAVRALYFILLGEEEICKVRHELEVQVDLTALDGEILLVDLLNELIYYFDAKKWILPTLEVKTVCLESSRGLPSSPCRLQGCLRGEVFDPRRHSLQTEIKSATFHDLELRRLGEGWTADVVFDL
jgi:SHS2 domain-containing protein